MLTQIGTVNNNGFQSRYASSVPPNKTKDKGKKIVNCNIKV